MLRRFQLHDYVVYPADFQKRGICWTFLRVSKARAKARSLGAGAWIRRYENVRGKRSTMPDFKIVRLWIWNGKRFVRTQEEPAGFQHEELAALMAEIRAKKSQF